ncbi:maleylpyruvate isomerase family mycothiol-dependent enzyme [Longivirga aurantiaca]|uniref:Maleylpyruvate isomerase family mycothiol-dependent enzyme n=1 Tax=Longivirga aurantiaca TaxID=1837743 RepID=A0ABW1SW33_9ACTN
MTTQPSLDSTRLGTDEYLAHLDADFEAMLEASTDLGAEVPGCPGWDVAALLSHVLGVYRHKLETLRTDANPGDRSEGGWGVVPEGVDVRDEIRTTYVELREILSARDADEPTFAWWPSEQTVGFWHRRMAQETTVHRWDAESATDGPDGAGDVPEDLAADGVDELLGWLRWPWDDVPQPGATGQRVLVAADDHSWTVTLNETSVEVVGGAGEADALVAGPASGLLLYLWGRPGEHGIATTGDETAIRLLRERLLMATS